MKKIEWSELPATFRDAVTVCRSMHVKYLWIDSLCILQSFTEVTPDELEVTRQDFGQETKKHPWHRYHMLEEATKPPPDDSKGPLEWWEQVVHAYTSRQLTSAANQLPALSGLSQQRKQVRGGVYLAGLWQDSLLHDLCWYHVFNYNVATSGGAGHRPPHYRAPSWSWAAGDTDSGCSWGWTGPIELHSISPMQEPKQACVILESSCEPATTDSTGEVRSRFLDLMVSLASAEICRDPEYRVSIHKLDRSLTLGFFTPDCTLEDDGLNLRDQVFCALVAGVTYFPRVDCACLVLKRVDNDIYQRVGFCTIDARHADFESHQEDNTTFDLENFAWPGSVQLQIRII